MADDSGGTNQAFADDWLEQSDDDSYRTNSNHRGDDPLNIDGDTYRYRLPPDHPLYDSAQDSTEAYDEEDEADDETVLSDDIWWRYESGSHREDVIFDEY
jgi:hypothetical protein